MEKYIRLHPFRDWQRDIHIIIYLVSGFDLYVPKTTDYVNFCTKSLVLNLF